METDNDQLPDPVEPKAEEGSETKDTAENKVGSQQLCNGYRIPKVGDTVVKWLSI